MPMPSITPGAPPPVAPRRRSMACRASAAALLACLASLTAGAQAVPWATAITPSPDAETLPEDRGADGLAQTLKKLRTWASLMMVVAHPDDEDGGMMTYESRGLGTRTTLFTLTRGEGGQNAMSSETYDALGLIRTSELLRADQYSGTEQMWGHFADYGFSKTKEEALEQWGHDRVLYDVVRAVRTVRPLVLTSVFVGGITDGHGHHQVSGEMAQEAFLAAGDPAVFPDQIASGLRPWKPLAVYGRTPFAPVTSRGMFDYATGKWAPVRFYNYVSKQWSASPLTPDVTIAEGSYDPILGRSYLQMAREGWGQQRSQYGGGTPPLPGPADVSYHRFGSLVQSSSADPSRSSFFTGIDTSLPGLILLAPSRPPFLAEALSALDRTAAQALHAYVPDAPEAIAPDLRHFYLQVKALQTAVAASSLTADEKADLDHELSIKLAQCNTALAEALGLQVHVLAAPAAEIARMHDSGLSPSPTPSHVTPGEAFAVRVHVTAAHAWSRGNARAGAAPVLQLVRTRVSTPGDEHWAVEPVPSSDGVDRAGMVEDAWYRTQVPANAAPTEPYFTRGSIKEAVYTVQRPEQLSQSFAPYPVSGWADFDYGGVPVRLGQVAQTAHRVHGLGMLYQPLVVAPAFSVSVAEAVAVLPSNQPSLPITVTVTNEQSVTATGTLSLSLPAGWRVDPGTSLLNLAPGEQQTQQFTLTLPTGGKGEGVVHASLSSGNSVYTRGFQSVGYEGLRPYALYRSAAVTVRRIDVHLAPSLRIGYVMGTGDEVPRAIAQLGATPRLLDAAELLRGDLSRYDTIVLGVRTYTAQGILAEANPRLLAWVKAGGTLVVQYQDAQFNQGFAPFPLSVGSERVIDEQAPVTLLAPDDPLLTTPNRLAPQDFAGWLEERGHGFADTWDAHYTAITETGDPGQDPQRGGLLRASYGKGQYIYVAFALYRQLPEGVPGSWRLLANLLSAGHPSR